MDKKTPWNSLYRTPNLEQLAARIELYYTRKGHPEKNNLFSPHPEKRQNLAKKLGEKLRNSNSKMLINKEKQKEINYTF